MLSEVVAPEEEASLLLARGLVIAVRLGEVGSATLLSLWSALWHLGSEWQAVISLPWDS